MPKFWAEAAAANPGGGWSGRPPAATAAAKEEGFLLTGGILFVLLVTSLEGIHEGEEEHADAAVVVVTEPELAIPINPGIELAELKEAPLSP